MKKTQKRQKSASLKPCTIKILLGVMILLGLFLLNFSITSATYTFTSCNSTAANRILNITFKDEVTSAALNATLDSASWVYTINGTTKTYTFSNSTANYEYHFCMLNRTLSVNEEGYNLVQSSAATNAYGAIFKPFRNITNFLITVHPISTASRCRLLDGSNTLLATSTAYNKDCLFNYTLVNGTTYKMVLDASGGSYTTAYNDTTTYPIVLADINYSSGADSSFNPDTGAFYMIGNFSVIEQISEPLTAFYSTTTLKYTHTGEVNYPQRTSYFDNEYYPASTSSKILYLLNTADGIYVTFQVINPAQQVVSDVTISVYSGATLIESKNTDSSGGATFFLNPLTNYNISAVKTGYTSTSIMVTPTQSSYTITISPSLSSSIDYTKGISTLINPTNSYLINNTITPFNLTLNSTFWTVTSFGFNILNSSGYNLGHVNDTTNGGIVNKNVDTGNNTQLFMNYYYVINGTYTNATKIFYVENLGDTSWSLKYLFTDLSLYLTSGLFGLDNFGLAILTFLTIFILTGVMSYKYGFTSPAAIMALIFGLVLFFDVGIGIMPNPVGAISHFPTYFIGIIFASLFIKEVIS